VVDYIKSTAVDLLHKEAAYDKERFTRSGIFCGNEKPETIENKYNMGDYYDVYDNYDYTFYVYAYIHYTDEK